VLVSHVDRLSGEDLSSMLEKLGTNGKLELHIIGAFADAMAISETLLVPVLGIISFFFGGEGEGGGVVKLLHCDSLITSRFYILFYFSYFFGGLDFVGHSFVYVAHF
jgi:hypothetical protein